MSGEVSSTVASRRPCTISVVSHRQGPLVERLLGDLAALPAEWIAKVVLTRNLPDDPIHVPSSLPFPLDLVDNGQPRGFGANHNAAFARCDTPWFAVLNPDLRLSGDPFAALLAAAQAETALLSPKVLEPDGRTADSARLLPTPSRLARRVLARLGAWPGSRGHAEPRESRAEWFAGMFMLLRSDALRAVGGFDERFHMYCEDVDLCARLRLAGWGIRQVDATSVVHDARRASRRSARHLGWHLASLCRLWASRTFWRYRALLASERRAEPSAHPMAGS